MMISLPREVENVVGKRESICLFAFSSFPTMFSRAFPFRTIENQDCLLENM